jgi:hypothetical protein
MGSGRVTQSHVPPTAHDEGVRRRALNRTSRPTNTEPRHRHGGQPDRTVYLATGEQTAIERDPGTCAPIPRFDPLEGLYLLARCETGLAGFRYELPGSDCDGSNLSWSLCPKAARVSRLR